VSCFRLLIHTGMVDFLTHLGQGLELCDSVPKVSGHCGIPAVAVVSEILNRL
jgi:hypothetical protein